MHPSNLFPYKWNLKTADFAKDRGKVFSCFSCGGGSTMGYKLAGFDVIGCNEIDPKMMDVYIANHDPKFPFLSGIQDFKHGTRKSFPPELYDLDILDGSPPCSSFSMVGNREKDWGKSKKFREGQAEQVLDNLFFDFIDLAAELRPKVVVAENVKGLLMGEARSYVREIYKEFDKAGYYVQHWLLNAADMGVPQKRERVFFVALRKDLAEPFMYQKDMFTRVPKLTLEFKEPHIPMDGILEDGAERRKLSPSYQKAYNLKLPGDICMAQATEREGKRKFFNIMYIYPDRVCYTITGGDALVYDNGYLTDNELKQVGTYPMDYNFGKNKPVYLIGMSVPPVMVAQIATKIWEQWLIHITGH